jgi:hypothetical protein
MALWRRTESAPLARVEALEARLAALEPRLKQLEGQELELAELRRTAANAVRSLTRHALNATEKAEPGNGKGAAAPPPPQTLLEVLRSRHALPHRP